MVQLRSRGVFFGFLELQQSNTPRDWGSEEAVMIQTVAEMLSVLFNSRTINPKLKSTPAK